MRMGAPMVGVTKTHSRYAFQVEPIEFSKLKKGGEENDSTVQAYIVSTGTWANGKNHMIICFDQRLCDQLMARRA